MLCFSGPPGESSSSLAVRQECHSATDCHGSSLHAFFGEFAGGVMGQGEVHVVAADQEMIADRDPLQSQLAAVLRPRRPA